jgi:4-amino-4-deoxy-L-arabinose transferase-like glycosyltransferase
MEEKILKYDKWIILLVWAGIFLPHLGLLPVNIMEARNFVTAREMIRDGNWILTTMNGMPRYEKPPLPTWLTAFSALIFGLKSVAALRLPAALAALVLILFTRRLSFLLGQSKRFALHTALILATSFYVIYAGRDGSWDVYAHAFMMGGIFFLFKLLSDDRKAYQHGLASGLFLGLSFLSKGPVSHFALLLPFLIAYGFVYNYRSVRKKIAPLSLFFLIAFIVSAWWPLTIYFFDRTDAETIAKIESNAWLTNSVRPIYYYWSFFTQSGIWTIPAFVSLLYPYLKNKVSNSKAYQFTFLWTIFAVLLLSLIPEKKARYLFPVLIPLAFNVAFYVDYLWIEFKNLKGVEKLPVYIHFGILILVGLAFPFVFFFLFGRELSFLNYWYFGASVLMFSSALWMLKFLGKKDIPKLFFVNIIYVIVILVFAFPLCQLFYDDLENKATQKILMAEKIFKTATYSYGEISPEILWQFDAHVLPQIDAIESLPNFQKATFLVNEGNEKTFLLNFRKDFKIKFLQTIDLNHFSHDSKNYKERLANKLFLIEAMNDKNLDTQ